MALTTDGKLLLAANNAEDPPFVTLFAANGDNPVSDVTYIKMMMTVDPSIIPPGNGLSIEQPAWDPKTKRFYTSIPQIANNPPRLPFRHCPFLQRRSAGDRSGGAVRGGGRV